MRHKYLTEDDILYEDEETLYLQINYYSTYGRSKWNFYSEFRYLWLSKRDRKRYKNEPIYLVIDKKSDTIITTYRDVDLENDYFCYKTNDFVDKHSDLLLTDENLKRSNILRNYIEKLRKGLLTESGRFEYSDINQLIVKHPSLLRRVVNEEEYEELTKLFCTVKPIYYDKETVPNAGLKNFDYDIVMSYGSASRTMPRLLKSKGMILVVPHVVFLTMGYEHFYFTDNINKPEWIVLIGKSGYIEMVLEDLKSFGYPEENIKMIVDHFAV